MTGENSTEAERRAGLDVPASMWADLRLVIDRLEKNAALYQRLANRIGSLAQHGGDFAQQRLQLLADDLHNCRGQQQLALQDFHSKLSAIANKLEGGQ